MTHVRCGAPRRALRRGRAACALWLGFAGCATSPDTTFDERRAQIESQIEAEGLANDPAIDAARGELDAALAREGAEVAVDGVEVRAALVHERDDKAQVLVRLPIRNPFELHEAKKARRAQTQVALAHLEEVSLGQRVASCVPSLAHLVRMRHVEIYERYARRHRALLDWNRELRESGLIDEVLASRFELASRVGLATRDPSGLPEVPAPASVPTRLDVLPEPDPDVALLAVEPGLLRRELLQHQPEIGVHRAQRARFEALARRETASRVPSLRFVDVGFEPVAYPGDDRQVAARIAIDVPFGREASAKAREYEALARAERSGERAVVEWRRREALVALAEVNRFRRRAAHWNELLALADASEAVADRWWRQRLAAPREISNLLESVYDARLAVLDARRRAGLAGCDVIEATGVSVGEWPREIPVR